MTLILYCLLILAVSIPLMLALARFKKISAHVYLGSLVVACALGLFSASGVLSRGIAPVDFRLAGTIPLGEFYIGMDALSAFFLLLFFILSLAAGIYGYGYMRDYKGGRNLPAHFSLCHLLMIVIILVVVAKNAVLFLAAWELMTLAAYFLITFYNEHERVRKAGYVFLIATHTGTFCLLGMFLLMGVHAGSMDFDRMAMAPFPLGMAAGIFVLAFLGFGVKAGFIPLHVWLPHAHPEAPTHVSALLSGVVIKIGIYGLIRIMSIVKDFPLWCGIVLLATGIVSGVAGVLYALGQHEIKKLLAYHSIENIGIITLGLGIGMIGRYYHQDTVSYIGYAAALLHTFNHAVFKGLLFLSAGTVIRSTHTGEMDHMGGLLKWLPWTGHLFLIGSLSICGLPLFNGFISEWLVFRSLLEGVFHLDMCGIIFSTAAIVALGLIGGLAALCFAKAFGTVFLGHNRSEHEHHHNMEGDFVLVAPVAMLAALCLWVGLFPQEMVSYAFQGVKSMEGAAVPVVFRQAILGPLLSVTKVLFAGIAIFLFFALLRRIFLGACRVTWTETWGCGHAYTSSKMQYTASSFARPVLKIFRSVVLFRIKSEIPKGYFPAAGQLNSGVKDISEYFVFRPVFYAVKKVSRGLKWIQGGRTQSYILYILFLLVVLLIWKLR
ncbi:MAG: hydrogenase [Candidatus Omnitrophica bacterium]|nr:hydrogenase [Candidatus Omnitrophota bacterium]MDE2230950.1 hydrogenase [Candidatus Omnitrophota bacterium]